MFFTSTQSALTFRICFTLGLFTLFSLCAMAQTASPESRRSPEPQESGTSTIRGRVIYADTARPLRRAEVALVSQTSGSWGERVITNRSGEFVFTNISAGTYFVVVFAPDIVSPGDQVDDRSALAEQIALGQIEDGFSEVTVDGRSSAKTEIRAARGGVITGRVLSEDDTPIAGAAIKLYQSKEGRLLPVLSTWVVPNRDKRIFETDSRGVYRIAGLAGGEYIVRVSESNLGREVDDLAEGNYSDGSMLVAYYPRALRVEEATNVKVQPGAETKDVDIHLPDRSVHNLSGTVFLRGRPARATTVTLSLNSLEEQFSPVETRTDGDGKWEIRSVPDGVYTLTTSGFLIGVVELKGKRGYISAAPERREITVSGADLKDLNVELVEGGQLQGAVSAEGSATVPDFLAIALVPAALPARAKPATTAAGSVDQPSPKADNDNYGEERGFVRPERDFSISELRAGLFRFRIDGLGPNLYVKAITLKGKDRLRNPVKIESGKIVSDVQIVLAADVVALLGRAMEKSGSNKPMPDAAILLFPVDAAQRQVTGRPLVSRTDKEGRFVIKGAPGEYFVFVFDRGGKGKLARPTEETFTGDTSKLQKVRLQRGDEKRIVEVFGSE